MSKYDPDTALDLISQHESAGRNIKQQIVPAGGGYNPSVGRVTGPSTAGGPWQITNSTWRRRAPREIAQQYPTAMSAPVEVQREVARKIYNETGFDDWAPYNASLRRAIARGDQPKTQQQPDTKAPPTVPKFDDWVKSQRDLVVAPGQGKQGPMVVRRQAAEAANPTVSDFKPAPQSIPTFDDFQKRNEIAPELSSAQSQGSWASNLYNQTPRQPKPQPTKAVGLVPGMGGVSRMRTRPKPQGTGAQVAGEAQPSEATSARGALRSIAAMGGFPTQVPTQAGDFVNQMVAEGAAGLMQRGAGLVRNIPHDPLEGRNQVTDIAANKINQGAQEIGRASQAIDKDTIRSGVNVPLVGRVTTKDAQNVGSGAIASAPALALQQLGVPAPVAFGLDAYLASSGRGEELTTALKEAGLGAATGGLYEIPLPAAAKATVLRQIGAKLGLGAAGGYGLAKAFGVPEEEARKNAAVTALFMASGAQRTRSEVKPELRAAPDLDAQVASRESKVQPTFLRDDAGKAVARVLNPEEAAAGEKIKIRPIHQADTAPRDEGGRFAKVETQPEVAAKPEIPQPQAPQGQKPAVENAPLLETPVAQTPRRVDSNISPEPATEPQIPPPIEAAVAAASQPETKPSRLAQGVEAKAIEKNLTEGFKDLPEYKTVNVKDQAQKATALLDSDPELAKRIATGQEMPKGDLLPESVFTAVENRALANGDVQTIEDLARGSRSVEASGMGQRIRMLGERNPYSPVKAIADIEKVRSARVPKAKVAKTVDKIRTEVQIEMKKSAPKADAWQKFLADIVCR